MQPPEPKALSAKYVKTLNKQYEKKIKENKKNYVRVVPTSNGIEIQVCMIEWKSPHEPVAEWHTYVKLGFACNGDEIIKAIEKASSSGRFFETCRICLDLVNKGHMHDDGICQNCGPELFLGSYETIILRDE